MDSFMEWVLRAISEHGARAVRIFPPPSQVLLSFADRIANEVVSAHILFLLVQPSELDIGWGICHIAPLESTRIVYRYLSQVGRCIVPRILEDGRCHS